MNWPTNAALAPWALIVCLATAVALIPFRRSLVISRGLSLVGSLALLAVSLLVLGRVLPGDVLRMQAGSWIAPFGISFAIDTLGALMLVVTAVVGLCGNIAAQATLDPSIEKRSFHVFYHFLLMGCVGAFSTGDLFNLYVWFEVLLIASFVLSALSKESPALIGTVKYVSLSLVSSFFFLIGLGILYNAAGSLQMADLSAVLATQGRLMPIAAISLFMAFAIKAGSFPLFQWLPATYPRLPSAIVAVFAGLLTKVGMYALIRVFSAPLLQVFPHFHGIVLVLAMGTMLVGVLLAVIQNDIKKILSAHIISQIGYMLLGFAIHTTTGVAAAVFYLFHHIIVKANLFLIAAWIEALYGHCELKKLHALRARHHFLAISFAISALSLIGIPPLSGFWAKFFTLSAALEAGHPLAFFVALAVGALTLFSMAKIWSEAFWTPTDAAHSPVGQLRGRARWIVLPVILLNAWTLWLGLNFQVVWKISVQAADQILGGLS